MAEQNLFSAFSPLLDPFKSLLASPASQPNQSNQSTASNPIAPPVPQLNYTPANYSPAPANYTPAPQLPTTPAPTASGTSSNSYTVKSGDTLSAIAKNNNMSLADLLKYNPQYQSNPNLIRPGESVSLGSAQAQSGLNYTPDPNAGLNYTPAPLNYTPVPPANYTPVPADMQLNYTPAPNYTPVPANQTYPSSNTGTQTSTPTVPKINPETGGTAETSEPAPAPALDINALASSFSSGTSTSGGGAAPAAPNISSISNTPGYDAAVSAYENSLLLTPEELENQKEINRIKEAAKLGIQGEGERPIAMEFITGRQKSIENRALNQLQPLIDEAALLQAQRTGKLDAAKFKLGIEEAKAAEERSASRPIAGSSFFDPITKQFFSAPSEESSTPFTLSEGQIRFDSNGNIVAQNTGGQGDNTGVISSDASQWAALINSGRAGIDDVPNDIRTDVARALSTLGGLSKGSQDAITQAGTVIGFINQATPMINGLTTGVAGKAAANIPGTDAYNLERVIDTIKANVGFSALQAMRAASPTGGALGQVSEQENKLLQSTLGSLDIGQSPEQLKANLENVKIHFNNLINILNAAAQPASSGTGFDDDGGWSW